MSTQRKASIVTLFAWVAFIAVVPLYVAYAHLIHTHAAHAHIHVMNTHRG